MVRREFEVVEPPPRLAAVGALLAEEIVGRAAVVRQLHTLGWLPGLLVAGMLVLAAVFAGRAKPEPPVGVVGLMESEPLVDEECMQGLVGVLAEAAHWD